MAEPPAPSVWKADFQPPSLGLLSVFLPPRCVLSPAPPKKDLQDELECLKKIFFKESVGRSLATSPPLDYPLIPSADCRFGVPPRQPAPGLSRRSAALGCLGRCVWWLPPQPNKKKATVGPRPPHPLKPPPPPKKKSNFFSAIKTVGEFTDVSWWRNGELQCKSSPNVTRF